ncbi:MAG TPA: heparinase II/III family protein [Cellulomonas sp.]
MPFVGPLARRWPDYAERLPGLLAATGGALPVPSARDRDAWSAVDPTTAADLLARARADLGTQWPATPVSLAVRVHRDGDRDAYEQRVFARQRRLSRAVVAAALTGQDVFLDEVADGAVLLCEQSSWCWPAHDDSWAVHGSVLPVATDPFLDLGAAEVAAQLAWLDAVLADDLDARWPGLRRRIAHEVHRRTLEPFLRRRDWHWLGLDGDVHNWDPWICGNLLAAALRLAEPAVRDAVLPLVVEGLDRYAAAIPADGATDEGFHYWWNGACRLLEALELLSDATGGALDASGLAPLRATVAFPHRCHLGGPWFLNVADGPARPADRLPWPALHRLAGWLDQPDARAFAAGHRVPGEPVAAEDEGLGRLLRALVDPGWRAATDGPGRTPLPRDVWLPSVQLRLVRPAAGSCAGLTLAVKGGHNGEHHNHNDVGEVVVALGGVPVLVDAGRPTYTAQTFGPDRYTIWTMRSGWHNVPGPAGREQGVGQRYRARDVVLLADPAGPAERPGARGLRLDLAPAYPDLDGRWVRTATLAPDGSRVRVEDRWELAEAPERPSVVRYLLAGRVRSEGSSTLLVTPLGGGSPAAPGCGVLRLGWTGAHGGPARLEPRDLDDPLLRAVWGPTLTLLHIDLGTVTSGTLVLTMEET